MAGAIGSPWQHLSPSEALHRVSTNPIQPIPRVSTWGHISDFDNSSAWDQPREPEGNRTR